MDVGRRGAARARRALGRTVGVDDEGVVAVVPPAVAVAARHVPSMATGCDSHADSVRGMRTTSHLSRWIAAACLSLALFGGAACGDDEKDEPQRDGESEKLETPTSVQDTRTTL